MLTKAPAAGTQAGNTKIPAGAGSRRFTRNSAKFTAAKTHRMTMDVARARVSSGHRRARARTMAAASAVALTGVCVRGSTTPRKAGSWP